MFLLCLDTFSWFPGFSARSGLRLVLQSPLDREPCRPFTAASAAPWRLSGWVPIPVLLPPSPGGAGLRDPPDSVRRKRSWCPQASWAEAGTAGRGWM